MFLDPTMLIGARLALRVTRRLPVGALMLLIVGHVAPAGAQFTPRLDLGGLIEVGGEAERYLRVLQVAGLAPLRSSAIAPISVTEAKAMRPTGASPWSARLDTSDENDPTARALRVRGRIIENSSFPYQEGGGPTWAGRGLTADVQGGVYARWHALTVQLAPLAFAAQNAPFTLAPNGTSGTTVFGDARFPLEIDAPQRFGTQAYRRLDLGATTLEVDGAGLTAGFTSAPQRWGPAREYPLVLGPNAGGFPMLFFGTATPVDLWLFRLHGRLVYGQLSQSAFAAPVDGVRRRLATGVVATILPRGAPGLELGGSRFNHEPYTRETVTLSALGRPLANGLNLFGVAQNDILENEVASIFARWAFPRARTEVYGEMYREDFPGHFHTAQSLVEKPDDLAAFTLGFQHVLSNPGAARLRVVRAELVNGETSHQERGERGFVIPLPPYVHTGVTQGHTQNGLLLGSPEAYGGAGWRVGYDDYTPAGRRTLSLERSLRFDWLPGFATGTTVHPDVVYAARAEMVRFRGRSEYRVALIPAIDLNRNLVAFRDAWNVAAVVEFSGF